MITVIILIILISTRHEKHCMQKEFAEEAENVNLCIDLGKLNSFSTSYSYTGL